MANADKGSVEVISGSIGDLIFRIETLTSDRDTIKLCVRAAAEYEAMRAQLTKFAADEGYCAHDWSFPPEFCPVCNKRVPLIRLSG